MNKSELIDEISDRVGVSKKSVGEIIDEFSNIVCNNLSKGEETTIPGLVKFKQVDRAARTGHNPQTGEKMHIPACKAAKVEKLSKLVKAGKGEA